nr:MAG TPA: cytokine receptor common subunit [Caudoviricetes sp.]
MRESIMHEITLLLYGFFCGYVYRKYLKERK